MIVHRDFKNALRGALLILVLSLSGVQCTNFVQSVEPPLNTVADDKLNSENDVPFLITGLKGVFNLEYASVSIAADGLSDDLFFDRSVVGATDPSHAEVDQGTIQNDNGLIYSLGAVRLLADTLIYRVNHITFKNQQLRKLGLYNGYLYGGLERYMWAAYFGKAPTVGGGVIDGGAFIPSAQMYALALERFDSALRYAPTENEQAIVNSLIARVELYLGNYDLAANAAMSGLVLNSIPLTATFTASAPNPWYYESGPGRTEWAVAPRFVQYINDDPAEAARIQIAPTPALSDSSYARVDLYNSAGSPMTVVGWQETHLILAETSLRSGDTTSALGYVNDVRTSYNLTPVDTLDMNTIITERDETLAFQGLRLMDERRFNIWHLPAGTWEYFPLSLSELTNNPHLH